MRQSANATCANEEKSLITEIEGLSVIEELEPKIAPDAVSEWLLLD